MNWDVIAAGAEAIGALAVVLSLLYLTRQVKQTNDVARASYHLAQSTNYRSLALSLASDASLQSIYRRGLLDPRSLDVGESGQFALVMIELFQHLQAQVEGADAGVVRQEIVEKWATVVAGWVAMPGGREVWNQVAPVLSDDTRSVLEAALVDARPMDQIFPQSFHARSE